MSNTQKQKKILVGMDTLLDRLLKPFLYTLSYSCWYIGLSELLRRFNAKQNHVSVVYYHRVSSGMELKVTGNPCNITSKPFFKDHVRYFSKYF